MHKKSANKLDFAELESRLGHRFANTALLEEALTHPSLQAEKNYERLELLGDAVLELVITEHLINAFPEEPEGALAKRRAALVKSHALAHVATHLGLGEFLLLSAGEETNGGRSNVRNLENTLEAIFGAMYLDADFDTVRKSILPLWLPLLNDMPHPPHDPKTELQEWAQQRGKPLPEYKITERNGPDHSPEFTVQVHVEGVKPVSATGASKQKAERKAAETMLKTIHG